MCLLVMQSQTQAQKTAWAVSPHGTQFEGILPYRSALSPLWRAIDHRGAEA